MSSSASSVSSSSSVASEPISERPMALFVVVFFGCGRGSETSSDSLARWMSSIVVCGSVGISFSCRT